MTQDGQVGRQHRGRGERRGKRGHGPRQLGRLPRPLLPTRRHLAVGRGNNISNNNDNSSNQIDPDLEFNLIEINDKLNLSLFSLFSFLTS